MLREFQYSCQKLKSLLTFGKSFWVSLRLTVIKIHFYPQKARDCFVSGLCSVAKVRILHLRSDLRLQKCSNRGMRKARRNYLQLKGKPQHWLKPFLLSAAVSHLMLSDLASSWQSETPCKMRHNKARRQRWIASLCIGGSCSAPGRRGRCGASGLEALSFAGWKRKSLAVGALGKSAIFIGATE